LLPAIGQWRKGENGMDEWKPATALIVGAGAGLSASIARAFAGEGMKVTLAARDVAKLESLSEEIGAETFACDASDAHQVETLFASLDTGPDGAPDVVVYNPSYRARGPLVELKPDDVARTLMVTAFGGFLVGQQAVRRMTRKGRGVIVFTGASASIKGYAQSAPFAMGKFALRGLAQSMAREFQPHGIHIAHVNIDGGIRNEARGFVDKPGRPDSVLDPDAIATTYLHLVRQHRSAWTFELEVRPWLETF
jgi:NAD(P)-dependent dehydrogenase (short-subunit alcohol dehydrogenase family)